MKPGKINQLDPAIPQKIVEGSAQTKGSITNLANSVEKIFFAGSLLVLIRPF